METTPCQLPEIALFPGMVSGDQSDAGIINERITYIQRASTLLSNSIVFSPLRGTTSSRQQAL